MGSDILLLCPIYSESLSPTLPLLLFGYGTYIPLLFYLTKNTWYWLILDLLRWPGKQAQSHKDGVLCKNGKS